MAYINWSDDLSVSVFTIDNQHKKLVGLINEFYESIKNGSSKDNVSKLIKGMKNYTHEHFGFEEKYMRQCNYPDYENHKKEHELFISKVEDLETKLNSGKIVLSFEVTSFLKDWLKNHIQVEDKKYSSLFTQKGLV
jgi:hemerythrin